MANKESHTRKSGTNHSRTKLSEKVEKNLLSYVAAATAAGVGALTGITPAQAKVVYTPANIQLGSTFFLDLNHDGVNDFRFIQTLRTFPYHPQSRSGTNWVGNLAVYGLDGNQVWGQGTAASALPLGVRVGSSGKFPGGDLMVRASSIERESHLFGPWKSASAAPSTVKNHFLGFKFFIKGEIHYGWARFNVSCTFNAHIQATLTGYAYETKPDTPIQTVGFVVSENRNVPDEVQPASVDDSASKAASLGLLAAGERGIAIWRRRLPVLSE